MNLYGVEMTYNNLEAMISNRRDRRTGNIWEKTAEFEDEEIKENLEELTDALGEDNYEDTYRQSLAKISDKMSDMLMNPEDTYIAPDNGGEFRGSRLNGGDTPMPEPPLPAPDDIPPF